MFYSNNSHKYILPINCFLLIKYSLFETDKYIIRSLYDQWDLVQFINFDSGRGVCFKLATGFSCVYSNNVLLVSSVMSYPVRPRFSQILNRSLIQIAKLIHLVSYGFFKILQFIGFRHRQRWLRGVQVLRGRFGYTKKVWLKCPHDFVSIIRKQTPKKRHMLFFSFEAELLTAFANLFYMSRRSTFYKGRGINFIRRPLGLKEGKRALW